MFLTQEQARARLESSKNLANLLKEESCSEVSIEERVIERPGKKGPNLTEETRTEIATRARLGERQIDLAEEFQVPQSAISLIKNGKVKGIDENKAERAISSVRDKALDRLMASLGLISDDKLSGCSAKDLSVIASNMGRVVEKTLPKSEQHDHINLVIYAPELRQEKSYKVVEVG
jgi:hypothetical protein